MAAPGTLEDLPHPGSWSSRDLDHSGFWTASQRLPATIWANVSELPATGGKLWLTQSPMSKTGSFHRLWYPPGQTTLKQPRPEHSQVSSPHCPPIQHKSWLTLRKNFSEIRIHKLMWVLTLGDSDAAQSTDSKRMTLKCHRKQWTPSLKRPGS